MDIEVIQGRIDDLSRDMLAKGLRNPRPLLMIENHVAPCIFLQWGIHGEDQRTELLRDPDVYQLLTDAFALIESLPSAEEAKRQQFMSSLAKVIDLGRENGIEVDFLNPLTETMKRLSENALTYQPRTEMPAASWSGPKSDAEIAMKPNDLFDDLPIQRSDYSEANIADFDDGNITP